MRDTEAKLGVTATVGIGIPGVISPATGRVKNANSTTLNGHPFDQDISDPLGREVRVENDANCFALSEAADGAGAGYGLVFGVILGTGVGGGIAVDGRVHRGPHGVAGEWGHNPLPWLRLDEAPGPHCWCGQLGLPGDLGRRPGAGARLRRAGSARRQSPARARRRRRPSAQEALARHADRLARGLAQVINLLDPDAIVLGGGLSNMAHLYTELPRLLPRHVFSDVIATPILQNRHGNSSGVRGAPWLWPAPEPNLSRCAGEVETRSGEGEGAAVHPELVADRSGGWQRADPITLTLATSRLDLSRAQRGRG